MQIRLRRTIQVECARVVGDVAFAEKRVVEHAVVVWAADQLAHGGPAPVEGLTRQAAGGPLVDMPPAVGRRLATACAKLGLLRVERRADGSEHIVALLPEGERVAASKTADIFVPQKGAWQVFWCADPLLPHPILRIEPWPEPPAHEEQRARKGNREAPRRSFVKVPELLARACDPWSERPALHLPAPTEGRSQARLLELGQNVETAKADADLHLELSVDPGALAPGVRLVGRLGTSSAERPLPPPAGTWTHAVVWQMLLRGQGSAAAWDPTKCTFRMPFSSLPPDARKSFRLSLPFKAPGLEGLGQFDDTRVPDVPLEPRSSADAQSWFLWLLQQAVDRAIWPEDYARHIAEKAARFSGHALQPPLQDDFANTLRGGARPTAAYWHLRAPLDLDGGASQ